VLNHIAGRANIMRRLELGILGFSILLLFVVGYPLHWTRRRAIQVSQFGEWIFTVFSDHRIIY